MSAARNFAFVSFLLFRSAVAGQTNKQEKEGTCRDGLNLVISCSRVFVRQPRRTFHEFRASLVSNFYVASMRVRQSWLTLLEFRGVWFSSGTYVCVRQPV